MLVLDTDHLVELDRASVHGAALQQKLAAAQNKVATTLRFYIKVENVPHGALSGSLTLYGVSTMGITVAAPLEWVESVSGLRLPPQADTRLQQLMDRHTEGLLTDTERAELEALVERSETLVLLRTTALQLLGRTPQ